MEPKLRAQRGISWRDLLWICAAQLHKIRKTKSVFYLTTETLYFSFPSIIPETILHPHSGFHKWPPKQGSGGTSWVVAKAMGVTWAGCAQSLVTTHQIPSKYTGPLQRGPSVSKRSDSHWHLLPPCTFEEAFSIWLKIQFCELGFYIQIHLVIYFLGWAEKHSQWVFAFPQKAADIWSQGDCTAHLGPCVRWEEQRSWWHVSLFSSTFRSSEDWKILEGEIATLYLPNTDVPRVQKGYSRSLHFLSLDLIFLAMVNIT